MHTRHTHHNIAEGYRGACNETEIVVRTATTFNGVLPPCSSRINIKRKSASGATVHEVNSVQMEGAHSICAKRH